MGKFSHADVDGAVKAAKALSHLLIRSSDELYEEIQRVKEMGGKRNVKRNYRKETNFSIIETAKLSPRKLKLAKYERKNTKRTSQLYNSQKVRHYGNGGPNIFQSKAWTFAMTRKNELPNYT